MSVASRLIEAWKAVDAGLAPALARTAGAPRHLEGPARDVLVLRLWGLGNWALVSPSLAAYQGRLRLLTLERHADFLRAQLPCAEILGLPDPQSPRGPLAFLSALAQLRRDPPERVVDLESFLHLPLGLVRAATRAPCVGALGASSQREQLLDVGVDTSSTAHAALRFAEVLQAAGLPTLTGPGALLVPPAARRQAEEAWSSTSSPRVLLHPGSGDHFAGRRWPAERFAQLARELHEHTQAEVLLTGTQREAALLARVARGSRGASRSLAGQLDLPRLLGLIESADLLVTNDTGPLHLADGLDTPTVALFGPNTPSRYGPRRAGSIALFAELPCSPCLSEASRKSSRCRDYACMRALTPHSVLRASLSALATRPRSTPTSLESARVPA